jgi:UDP-N-acetylmuramyl pentapeptide phosphotransferase/UDP-N-acetylglucosamine-1-phosphate transferase
MDHNLFIALLCFLAFAVAWLVYYPALRFARRHDILDNPNERKLQRVPVPVFGGVVVFSAVLTAMAVAMCFGYCRELGVGLFIMALMMLIGVYDDMRDMSAHLKFFLEILIVFMLMGFGGNYIDDFHGLWGLDEVTFWFSLPLSIIAGVGIINAVNLIDGVDGYLSGYGMMACVFFSLMFFDVGDVSMGMFTVIFAFAMLPFFLHNVFGDRTKMFMGDGGSLMTGTAMTIVVFAMLSSNSMCRVLAYKGVGLIPFSLAVLAIPVFDTLRVMTSRIIKGKVPFHPDKTHLHHLFIDYGFSHLGTALSILFINQLIVAAWYVSYRLGASIDLQLYIVVGLSVLMTFGFYRYMRRQMELKSPVYHFMRTLAGRSRMEQLAVWPKIRSILDSVLK